MTDHNEIKDNIQPEAVAVDRKSSSSFYVKAAILSLVIVVLNLWFTSNFRIGIDGQEIRCLPDHKYFLVDMRKTQPELDSIMAYSASGLEPWFIDGTMMAKIVSGMPGDRVVVNEQGVFVNGEIKASGFLLANTLEMDIEQFFTSYTIPEDHLLMLAPAPESYDGRYWGLIHKDQLVGKVRPLL